MLRLQEDPVFATAAPINQHVLVYHRGVGLDKVRGFFLMRKVGGVLGSVCARGWPHPVLGVD